MELAIKLTIKDESESSLKTLQALHDIRSPLGALKILLRTMEGPSDHREVLEGVVRRIETIAADLLERGSKAPCYRPLQSTLDTLIKEKELLLKSQCQVHVELDPSIESTLVERTGFSRALSNLINNAYEAGASRIHVQIRGEEDTLIMMVSDDGKGMPASALKILSSHERCSAKAAGHGLGLHQVRDFANKQNGLLKIESETGRGTDITVTWKKGASDGSFSLNY